MCLGSFLGRTKMFQLCDATVPGSEFGTIHALEFDSNGCHERLFWGIEHIHEAHALLNNFNCTRGKDMPLPTSCEATNSVKQGRSNGYTDLYSPQYSMWNFARAAEVTRLVHCVIIPSVAGNSSGGLRATTKEERLEQLGQQQLEVMQLRRLAVQAMSDPHGTVHGYRRVRLSNTLGDVKVGLGSLMYSDPINVNCNGCHFAEIDLAYHDPLFLDVFGEILKNRCADKLGKRTGQRTGESCLIVDVGANVGYVSMLAVPFPGLEVFAFEPNEREYEHLVSQLELNDIAERVHAARLAVSDKDGSAVWTNAGTGSHIGHVEVDHSW